VTDDEEIALAKRLPKGARNALMALTDELVLPGRKTFNANGAFNLLWYARPYGGLATYSVINRRAAYRRTPLGARIQDRLIAAQGIVSREGEDAAAASVSEAN
jgi:hypothetical protein